MNLQIPHTHDVHGEPSPREYSPSKPTCEPAHSWQDVLRTVLVYPAGQGSQSVAPSAVEIFPGGQNLHPPSNDISRIIYFL